MSRAIERMVLMAFTLLLSGSMLAQLTGTKSIPGDYATVSAAITDLNAQGVGAGGVTFNVAAGHTEALSGRITMTATGTAANPIVFQKSGAGANPALTAYTGTVATPSVIADGMFVLAGSDYVTIDGIDLQEDGANTDATTQMEFGYGLLKASATDGCQNNVIRNCAITLGTANFAAGTAPWHNGSNGIVILNALHNATGNVTVTAPSGSNSNNQIRSNTLTGGNAGVVLIGFAATGGGPAPDPGTFLGDLNNDIGGNSALTGNTIVNFGGAAGANQPATGVFANSQWGLNVSFNTINNNDGGGANHPNTLRGIFLNSSSTSASVNCNDNNITVHGGGTTQQVSAIENSFGSTAAGNTVSISNNTVTGDYLTATSGFAYLIYSTSTPSVVSMSGNQITGFTLSNAGNTGTGSHYGIYCTGASASTTYAIDNNTVSNMARTGTTGGTTIGIYMSASTSGMIVNVTNNTISNLSIDGTGATSTMYGIQTSTGTITVDGNTVTNLQCLKTTGTGTMYGIYDISSPVDETYTNNQVNNLLHSGTGTVYGIYAFTTTGVRNVAFNDVHTLRTAGTTISGIQMSSSSPTIVRNRIYDIESTSTGSPTVSGLMITSVGTAGSVNAYNNLIGDLRAPNASTSSPLTAPTIRGINLTLTTTNSTVNLGHNTVHLNASSTGTNFSSAALYATTSTTATTAALNLRNNILSNASAPNGTGFAAAYWRSSTTLTNFSNSSDNNLFYAGVPGPSNLIFRDGTNSDQLLTDYQTRVAPRDAASISESPNFLSIDGSNSGFLHIDPSLATFIESGGAAIPGVGIDYDGDVRNGTTPDIGADEFTGSQPAVCTGTPAASTITGDAVVCEGSGTTLGLDIVYTDLQITYQWRASTTPGGPYSITLGTSAGQATGPMSADMYYICEVTCNNGGPFTFTTSEFGITVNPTPTASASAGLACLSQTLQLDGTTDIGDEFSWTGPNSFSSSVEDPTVDPVETASAGTYTFVATLNGCPSLPATVVVSTIALPSITSLTATPNPVCIGADAQLNATAAAPGYSMGSGGASWIDISGTGTSVGTVGDDTEHNISVPSFTFNGVEYTTARVGMNGALVFGSSSGDVSLTNATLPSAAHSAGNVFLAPWWDDLDIQGGASILTETIGNTFIVQWNNVAHNNVTAGTNNIYFQIQMDLVTGEIFFVYQDVIWGDATYDAGASATVGMQWANAAGGFIQYSFNTASLTDGQVISFTPNTPSYSWSPNTYLTADNIADPIAEAVAADITYTLTVTAAGCSTEGTLLVEANPAIAPSEAEITPDPAEFCTGSTVTLTAAPLGGGGPYSFTWSDPNAVVYGPSALATIDADVAGLWSVSIDDGCGGTATANVTVTENPTPTASATASQACLGGTLDLDGTTDIGTSFSWTGPDSFTSTSEDPSLSPVVTAMAGTYTFTATLGNCTSDPATVVVTTDEIPVISAVTATPNPVCTGNDAQLAVVVGGGSICPAASTNTTDEWITNVTFAGINNTSGSNTYTDYTAQVATVTQGAIVPISVDVTNQGTAAFTETVRAYVDWNQDGVFGSGEVYDIGSQVIASGASANFSSSISVPAGAAGGTSRLRVIQRFNAYHDASGCGTFTFGEVEDYTVLVSNGSPAFTYLWTPNTFLSADDISNPVASAPTTTTAYSVEVTAANGCSSTDNVTLTVNQTPDVDLAVAQDCVNEQYSISIQVNSTGNGPTVDVEYTVNGGSPVSVTGLGAGPQTPLGPFNQLDELVVTVIDPAGGCNSAPQPFLSGCPELVDCGLEEVIVKNYCYGNDDTRGWLFQTADGLGTLTLQFIQGEMAAGDVIRGYSGIDNSGSPIDGGPGEGNLTGNFPSLTGVTGVSSGASLFIEIDSDGSGSCQDAGVTIPWQWQVQCTPGCVQPDAAITHTLDCTAQTFDLNVEVLSAGDGSTFTVDVAYTIGLNGTQQVIPGVFEFDIVTIPGINLGDTAYVYLLHADNPSCDRNMGFFTHGRDECPNDEPCSAWILPMNPDYSCADVVSGDISAATLTAGITGGCTGVVQDQWYRFTATATTHRVQLSGTTTGLSHSIYVGSPDCNTLTLVAGTACVAGATASNPAGLTIGEIYYVRVSRTTTGTNAYTVCVSAPPLIDVDATVLVEPLATGCYTNAEDVIVTVLNNSIYPLDLSVNPLTVNVNVTGAATVGLSGTVNTGTVAPAATINVPMSSTLDMTAAGTYTFNGSAVVAGDGNTANDAMTAASRTVVASTALPITQNFTGFSGGNMATLAAPNNGWREGNGATLPGGTTSAWTSSLSAQQTQLGSGVSARLNFTTSARNEWIVSPKFTPVLGTQLSYSIAITEVSTGAVDPAGMQVDDQVIVKISTDCGVSYSSLLTHGQGNTGSVSNSLVPQLIDLSAYAGQAVIIAFHGTKPASTPHPSYDFHIDNIGLQNAVVCNGPPVAGTAAITNAGPACVPASTSLSVSGQSTDGGVVVNWLSSSVSGGPYTAVAGSGTSIGLSGIMSTTYYVASVKCLITNDSTITNEVSIQITPTPSASASAGPACTGQDLNLTGTTDFGTSFSWTGPNGFSSTDQNPIVSPVETASAGTYTFTATANGCPTSSTVDVVVNNTPVINSLTANPNPICINGNSLLSASAPVAGYVMGNGGATWIDISGTGTSVGTVGDDTEHNISVPSFTFNGVTYTEARVGMNGALVFGSTSGDVALTNATLPSSAHSAGNVFLAPWWDDLDIQGGASILTQTVGDLFIVQWNNVAHNNVTAGTNNIYFQIQMDLVTGDIWFVYQDVIWGDATYDAGASATIGMQWANSAGEFLQYSFNTASLSDGQVISFTPNQASFLWSPNTYLDFDNIADPLAQNVAATITYDVTATAAGCTSAPSQITVTANPALQAGDAEITPASPSFCSGSDVVLTANPLGGGGPYTYAWTDPSSNPAGTDATQTANVPGTWSVVITDNCGGSASASIVVTEFPVPVVLAGSNSPVCEGSALNLTGSSDVPGSTFSWTGPNGFSSTDENPVILNATISMSGDYTLVATANGCTSDPAVATVSVGGVLNGVSASASPLVVCAPGGTIDLFSTGAGGDPDILVEDFNGAAAGWTTTNTTTTTGTGNVALAAWTLQPDGITGPIGGVIHSNDASQFYMTNSDAPGSGNTTNTTLVSPAFSLVGYTDASLSFWHRYDWIGDDNANVEISTDGGGSWTSLVVYAADQGAPTAFANANIPLNAYLGMGGLRIRFRYFATWDWYWAIDNVSITGTPAPATFSWSSNPSGFSSTEQNPTGVAFNQTTVYTVTVEALGCTADADVTVYLGNNDLTFEFETDDNASEISWELYQDGTNLLLQSGSGLPQNAVAVTVFSCLPDGCFYLRVLDAGGDGIANGGYILREGAGAQRRIIDNRDNFSTGSVSAIANNGEFCLPLGDDRLIYTSTDKLDWRTTPCNAEYVVANDNPAVTAQYGVTNATSGYQMWWFDPNGGYSFRRYQSHSTANGLPASATRACHFRINAWTGNQLQEGVLYNVKVRGRVNGTFLTWGQASRFMLNNAAAQCPSTKLMDIPGNNFFSCGAFREVATNSYVHAVPKRRVLPNCSFVNANRYQFRFRIIGEGFVLVKTSATGQYFVNTTGLECDKTYEVDVRVSFDNGATWCVNTGAGLNDPAWGDVCLVTTTCSSVQGGAQNMGDGNDAELSMYPNPNRGDQLFLSLSQVEDGVNTVSVDIYDGFGKRVSARTIAVQDGFINTVLDLNGELATGLYLVNITAGEKVYTERLVVQP